MNIKKRNMIIYIEFFDSQNPEEIEYILRDLIKRGLFPRIQKLFPYVHAKNLRAINIKDIDYPMVINKDDIKKTE